MTHGTTLVATTLFLVWSVVASAEGVAPSPKLSETDVKAIRATVNDIRATIIAGNVKSLLVHISQNEGLACTDTQYSYTEAKAFLQDSNSAFYMSLFDTAKFRKECGSGYPPDYPAISEKEFFKTANQEVSIEAINTNWVKVTIRSPIKSHYERWLYLHREGSVWRVGGGSFIIGNCTCG